MRFSDANCIGFFDAFLSLGFLGPQLPTRLSDHKRIVFFRDTRLIVIFFLIVRYLTSFSAYDTHVRVRLAHGSRKRRLPRR